MSAENGNGDSKLEGYWQKAREERDAASKAEAEEKKRVREWYKQFSSKTESETKAYKEHIAAFELARKANDYASSLSLFKAAEASLARFSEAFLADSALHFSLQVEYGYDIRSEQRNKKSFEQALCTLEELWADALFEQGKKEAAIHHASACNKLLALFKQSSFLFYLEDMNKILKRYDNNPRLKELKKEINRRLMIKKVESMMFFTIIPFAFLVFLIPLTVIFPITPLITVTTVLSLIVLAPFLIWAVSYVQGAMNKMTPEKMQIKAQDLTSSQLTESAVRVKSAQAADLFPQSTQSIIEHDSLVTLNSEQKSQHLSASSHRRE